MQFGFALPERPIHSLIADFQVCIASLPVTGLKEQTNLKNPTQIVAFLM